jgi:glutamate-1-semialdehyde 2,1-aminomutase
LGEAVTKGSWYVDRTSKSREMFERAKKVEPAGVSYRNRYFEPYPFFAKRAKGAKLIDLDGNEYTDYWCTHFAAILGHAHPVVMQAIRNQAENGWHHGVEHELEVTHAEALTKHVPSAEMVRYASSGSEANFFAVRLARTFTKRSKIAKFEGGWHGPYDALHLAIRPPFSMPPSGGITKGAQQDTIIVPYNELEGFLSRVKHEKLACVLVEPVLMGGGIISAESDFVKGLREYCDKTGTLLIFDEVVTGFRLGLGGAQGSMAVTPDLTVLGKIIGGGLPIGAVCGSREIMERMDHTMYTGLEFAYHGGTFAGNAMSLAAGLATIEFLERSSVYEHIDKLGKQTLEDLNRVFSDAGFEAQVTGVGSLFGIHMTDKKPLKDVRTYSLCNHEESKKMFSFLLENGIFILTPEMLHGAISYSHTGSDIKHLTSSVEKYVKNAC